MHGTVYSNYAINEADLLLAFGVRFDDRVTGKLTEFAKHGKIVHIDIDPSEINKNKFAHVPGPRRPEGRAGRPERAARGGAERRPDRRRPVPGLVAADRRTGATTEPLQVRRTATTPSCRSTPSSGCGRSCATAGQLDDTIVTTGVGQHQMWAAQYFHFNKPRHWITSGGLGTMGFGLPAAMGAQAAHPDKPGHRHRRRRQLPDEHAGTGHCVHARRSRSKVLLLNNQHLGMVMQWEDRFFDGNRGHTYLGAGVGQGAVPGLRDDREGLRRAAPAASPTRTTWTRR